jgi:hypothetical protein
MDLVTLAAYPIVFLLGKLRQCSKFLEGKTLVNSTVIYSEPLDG